MVFLNTRKWAVFVIFCKTGKPFVYIRVKKLLLPK